MLNFIRELIRIFHFDVKRFPDWEVKRRMQLLRSQEVNVVIDVGANVGQYAMDLLYYGYKGKIISFEPLQDAYRLLVKNSSSKNFWQTYNFALGSENTEAIINVTNNLASSSFLSMRTEHERVASNVYYKGKETVVIKTLDEVWGDCIGANDDDRIYLKIDTQGFEKNVLLGAKTSLPKIVGLQLEMSLIELYEGEWLYWDIINYLSERGFSLFGLEPKLSDLKTGQLMQMDGIFYRSAI